MNDLVEIIVAITAFFWVVAIYAAATQELDKSMARFILGSIFWIIGLPALIVMRFMKLFKTAFGKEEKRND